MIKREDITTETIIDKDLNQTKLVTLVSIGSIISLEGIEVPQELISGEAEEQRTLCMRHLYGDIDKRLVQIVEAVRMWNYPQQYTSKLIIMISELRKELQ